MVSFSRAGLLAFVLFYLHSYIHIVVLAVPVPALDDSAAAVDFAKRDVIARDNVPDHLVRRNPAAIDHRHAVREEYRGRIVSRHALRSLEEPESDFVARRGLFDGIKNAFNKATKAVGSVVKSATSAVKNTVNAVKSAPGKVFNAVKSTAGKVVNAVKKAPGKVFNAVKSVAGKVVNTVKNAPGKVFNAVKGAAGKVVNAVKNAPKNFVNGVKNVAKKVKNGVVGAVKKVTSAVGKGIQNVKTFANKVGNTVKKVGASLKGAAKYAKIGLQAVATASSVASKVTKFIPGVGPEISLALKATQKVSDIAGNAIPADVSGFSKGMEIMQTIENPSVGGALGTVLDVLKRDTRGNVIYSRDYH